MRGRTAFTTAIVGLAGLGPGADAALAGAPVAVSPAGLQVSAVEPGAPVIAGTAVAWPDDPLRLRIATPGAPARTLLTPRVGAGETTVDRATLAGSDGALAFAYQASDGGNTGGDDHDPETTYGAAAGPLAGPLAPIVAGGDDPPLAADGTTVASLEEGDAPGVLLTDVAAGTSRTLALPAPAAPGIAVDALALSPTSLAVLRSASTGDATVLVVDRASGQVAWTTTVTGSSRIGLEADGTLDVATRTGSRYALATATAAAPALRPVGTTLGVVGTPVVRDGRIAYGGTAPAVGPERRSQPLVQAFDGTPPQRLGFVGPTVVGVDVRGSRVAWRTPECVYVQDLPGEAVDAPPAGPCPRALAELDGPAPRLVPGGRVRATVSCLAAPGSCRTSLRLVVGRGTSARTTVAVPAGAVRRVSLRLPAGLPRRGAVRLRATTTDDAGRTTTRTLTYRL